ncbi:hypothetical protein BC834DRAFT_975772 [Gloeopeniophorella convolvens]|nr:hypothetical protein BC834DRAFT_975772 [Gloeopeniophorella convolvens]
MAPKVPQPKPIKQEKGASPAQTPGGKSIIAKASKQSLSSTKGDKVAPEPAASRAPSRAASTRSKQEPKAVQATFESSGEEAPPTRKVEKGKNKVKQATGDVRMASPTPPSPILPGAKLKSLASSWKAWEKPQKTQSEPAEEDEDEEIEVQDEPDSPESLKQPRKRPRVTQHSPIIKDEPQESPRLPSHPGRAEADPLLRTSVEASRNRCN